MTTKARKSSRIYVLGNDLVPEDRRAVALIPGLEKRFPDISFVHLDPTEDFPEEHHLILIDVVINLKEPTLITDISELAAPNQTSVHDLDLTATLKLLQKMGNIERVSIIGVPAAGDDSVLFQYLEKTIPSLL